jgi:ABC-type phosphate transport system substrate-binding protein
MIRLTKRRSILARRRGAYVMFAALLAVAFGAINVTSAAALGEQCSGTKATGLGAFLQTRAQTVWDSDGKVGFNSSVDPLACSGSQGSGGTPGVSYVPVSSSAALRTWGAEDGVLHEKEFGFPFHFIASDIAPGGPVSETGTMLANMSAALGSDVAVVPVTQTAIAIAAHPPALPAHPPCTVPRITANQLQRVFNGEIANWRQIATASDSSPGGDCDQAITRIVRDESAGTTYQLKHFLDQVNPSPLSCTGKEKRTWAQLQAPFGGKTPPNAEWPSNAQCQGGESHVTTVSGPGEGELGPLRFVAEAAGTITYGSVAEAQLWAPKQIINVNNGVKYTSPENGEGDANCGAAKYTRPAGWESGVDVDWSQVYGSDPLIGEVAKNAYPICTLTWDIAATNHFSEATATTVHDYLAFVAGEGGRAAVGHIGYRDLPAPIVKAATAAISHIDGTEEEGGEEEKEEGGTGTVLCKASPELEEGVLACPKGKGFSGKVTGGLMPETVATFESAAGPKLTVICPDASYAGEFNEDGTSAGNGISSLEFGGTEGCSTTFPEEPEAVVSFENPPYEASRFVYTNPLEPQGFFTLAKAKGQTLLRIQSGPVCVYTGGELNSQVTNGIPTEMFMLDKWTLAEESPEEACPTVLVSAAHLTVTTTGEPLYIAGK